jgi:hypothetical protein
MAGMRWRPFAALVAGVLLLASCKVRLLDDYSAESEQALLRTYGEVEALLDAIAEAPDTARGYQRYAGRYGDIQRMIRVQVVSEASRPLNAESHGIVSEIDTVFSGYRERHRTRGVDDTLLQRWRSSMQRMFTAALRAERVKRDPE